MMPVIEGFKVVCTIFWNDLEVFRPFYIMFLCKYCQKKNYIVDIVHNFDKNNSLDSNVESFEWRFDGVNTTKMEHN